MMPSSEANPVPATGSGETTQGDPVSGPSPVTPTTQEVGDLPTPSVKSEADGTVYLLGTAVTQLGFVVAWYVI